MTNSTHALFLTALTVVALGLVAALGSTVVGNSNLATGGALDVSSVISDGTPRVQRHLSWTGVVVDRPRETR